MNDGIQFCPECVSSDTEPFIADFDYQCRACGHYFDARTGEQIGVIEPSIDDLEVSA